MPSGREIDPIAVPGSDLAWMLFYARRYNDAVNEARSVLGVTPDDAFAGWILGFALIANHHPQEAVTVLEKRFPLPTGARRSSAFWSTLTPRLDTARTRLACLRN